MLTAFLDFPIRTKYPRDNNCCANEVVIRKLFIQENEATNN